MGNRLTSRKYWAASLDRFWASRKSQAMQLVVLVGIGSLIALTTIWPKLQVPAYAGLIFLMLPLTTYISAIRPIFALNNKWKLALVLTMLIILAYAIASIFEIVVETSYATETKTEWIFNPWGIFDGLEELLQIVLPS